MSTRSTSLADTLEKTKSRFLKVSVSKDGKYTTSPIQISSHKSVWAKNDKVVYSPATHLAGVKSDVIDYLKYLSDKSDSSADKIREDFENDSRMITVSNVNDFKDYIDEITLSRQKANSTADVPKVVLIDRQDIPDLLALVREMRGKIASSGRPMKTDIIEEYLKVVADSDRVFRLHGCGVDGRNPSDGSKLRSAARSDTSSKSSIFLSDDPSSPLNSFCIPALYEDKRYVTNFMNLYYIHVDKLKASEAHTKAKEFSEKLLGPYKKNRTKKARSTSPKSRSSTPSQKSRSATPKRRSSSHKKSRSPSPVKPEGEGEADSSKQKRSADPSPVREKTPPRSNTPKRSPSPRTSPQSGAKQQRRFRIPGKTN